MERSEAARILGVEVDADAAQVRRAYRLWARSEHPDAGGDPARFARLTQARRTMLRPRAVTARDPGTPPAPARPPVSAMLRLPPHLPVLVAAALGCLALGALPALGAGVPIAALACGIASATWSAAAARSVLRTGADAGHRIVVLTGAWLPLAAAQVALSAALKASLLTALPLLALPFAAVVASVNAGAGLWRPTGRG